MIDPKELIKQGKISPKSYLGQNFVVDNSVIDSLIRRAEINKKDRVIEIGAGLGTLTEPLLKKAGFVYAYEIDDQFKPFLEELARRYPNFEIRMENIREAKLPSSYNKVVGNIPYHISEPLVWKFRLEPVDIMVFVMGIRFAHKLTAKMEDQNYCDVSVIFQARFDISIEKEIARSSFYPQAPTKSALVKMAPVSIHSLLDNPPRYILHFIWNRKEMKLKNALREAFIDYVAEITKGKKRLTKNEARAFVSTLGLPKERLEQIVDSGNCPIIAKVLSEFDYGKLLKS